MNLKSYTTLDQAITIFGSSHSNKSQVTSAINRFLLPSFGLNISGSRLTNLEKEEAIKVAQGINLRKFDKEDLLNRVNSNFKEQKLSNSQQKSPKSHINSFINFIEKNNYIKLEKKEEDKQKRNTKEYYFKGRKVIDKTNLEIDRIRYQKETIKLSLDINDYQELSQELTTEVVQNELDRIKNELDKITHFMINKMGNRELTAKKTINNYKRLLGWLYLKEKDLSKVTFLSIIKVVNTQVTYFDYETTEDYFIQKGKLEYEASKAASHAVKWIESFFDEYKVEGKRTKDLYLVSLINISKWLYKNITNPEQSNNYEDIHVIRGLRVFKRNLPKLDKKLQNLYLSWEEVLEVRNVLKINADTTHCKFKRLSHPWICRKKRNKTAIARDLMKFLILCFFTIIPPDRCRTVNELCIGKTLKHGLRDESGGFIKYDNLPNKSLAEYYIHLQKEDYKTGDTYGEFWGTMPNTVFDDGSTFYEYLDKWIYGGWRQVLLDIKGLQHDYVFLGSRTSVPLKDIENGLNLIVRNIFKGKTGISLHPHKLRHIFCTYIDDLDITPRQRESIAFWMHHSESMSKNIYTIKTIDQKLAPGLELMQQISSSKINQLTQ